MLKNMIEKSTLEKRRMNKIQNRIYKYLADRIAGREITGKLPTEMELAAQFGTTRFNAQSAVRELEKAGIVERSRNRKQGTLVCQTPSCFQYGNLLKNVSRKLCILNFGSERFIHIHWNERLEKTLREKLLHAGISIENRSVSGIRNDADFQRLAEKIVSEGVNAFLVIPGGRISSSALSCSARLCKLHDRIFVYAFDFSQWDASAYNIVEINNFADGCTAAEAAILAGAKRILYCDSPSENATWTRERFRGASMACMRNGAPSPEKIRQTSPVSFPLKGPEPGTTIIAANDELAALLIDTGRTRNLEPGRDYRIIGFDNNPNYAEYELSTLAPDLERIGNLLAGEIIDVLEHRSDGMTVSCKIASKLIRRNTF